MDEPVEPQRKFGRFEYDPVTGASVLAAVVLVAVVLGAVAFNNQGSPRMDDKAIAQQGATIPNPTQLSPATTGSGTVR